MSDEAETTTRSIVDLVSPHIVGPWTRLSVEAEFDEGLVDFSIVYFDSNDREQEPDMEVLFEVVPGLKKHFVRLREISEVPEKGRWTKCVLTFSGEGECEREYTYGPSRWAE